MYKVKNQFAPSPTYIPPETVFMKDLLCILPDTQEVHVTYMCIYSFAQIYTNLHV